jgi:hypothetical protein
MNRFRGIDFASLCSRTGRYGNPIPTWFLAPIDCSKIPAQVLTLEIPFLELEALLNCAKQYFEILSTFIIVKPIQLWRAGVFWSFFAYVISVPIFKFLKYIRI